MSVIIKSNQKSVKNMGNIFGLSKTDYVFFADFNLDVYRAYKDGAMSNLTFSEALDFKRPSTATYIDDKNAVKVAAIDEPRFQNDKNGGRGLLLSPYRTELLSNPYAPATQTITIDKSGLVTLIVKGSGSATISGTAVADSNANQLVAKEGFPAFAQLTGASGNITVTVTGSLEVFGLSHNQLAAAVLDFVPAGATVTSQDFLQINTTLVEALMSGKKSFTALLTYRHRQLNHLGGKGNLFTLKDNSVTYGGLYAQTSGGSDSRFNVVTLAGNSNSPLKRVLEYSAINTARRKIAVTYSALEGKFQASENGMVYNSYSDTQPTELNISRVLISSANNYISQSANISAESFVLYDYKMTLDELSDLTKP